MDVGTEEPLIVGMHVEKKLLVGQKSRKKTYCWLKKLREKDLLLVSAAPQPAARALRLTTQGQDWKEDNVIKHILDSIREGVKKLFTKSVHKGCMYVTPSPPFTDKLRKKN